jgi:mannose-6-phosphate isomerase-like protein (cupin superfamily)
VAPSERNNAIAAPPRKRRQQPRRRQRHAITSQALGLKDNKPDAAHAFDITGAKARLCAADGGYEIVHESRRVQICVYALVAPEPDHQRINADDELYIVLEGSGMLDVDGEQLELREGHAAFVPAGAHHCFSAYEHLSVLAILEKRRGTSGWPPTAPSMSGSL